MLFSCHKIGFRVGLCCGDNYKQLSTMELYINCSRCSSTSMLLTQHERMVTVCDGVGFTTAELYRLHATCTLCTASFFAGGEGNSLPFPLPTYGHFFLSKLMPGFLFFDADRNAIRRSRSVALRCRERVRAVIAPHCLRLRGIIILSFISCSRTFWCSLQRIHVDDAADRCR